MLPEYDLYLFLYKKIWLGTAGIFKLPYIFNISVSMIST